MTAAGKTDLLKLCTLLGLFRPHLLQHHCTRLVQCRVHWLPYCLLLVGSGRVKCYFDEKSSAVSRVTTRIVPQLQSIQLLVRSFYTAGKFKDITKHCCENSWTNRSTRQQQCSGSRSTGSVSGWTKKNSLWWRTPRAWSFKRSLFSASLSKCSSNTYSV